MSPGDVPNDYLGTNVKLVGLGIRHLNYDSYYMLRMVDYGLLGTCATWVFCLWNEIHIKYSLNLWLPMNIISHCVTCIAMFYLTIQFHSRKSKCKVINYYRCVMMYLKQCLSYCKSYGFNHSLPICASWNKFCICFPAPLFMFMFFNDMYVHDIGK